MNKLRFALLGCGRIGERHAEQITQLGVLEAVCDNVVERQQYGPETWIQILF